MLSALIAVVAPLTDSTLIAMPVPSALLVAVIPCVVLPVITPLPLIEITPLPVFFAVIPIPPDTVEALIVTPPEPLLTTRIAASAPITDAAVISMPSPRVLSVTSIPCRLEPATAPVDVIETTPRPSFLTLMAVREPRTDPALIAMPAPCALLVAAIPWLVTPLTVPLALTEITPRPLLVASIPSELPVTSAAVTVMPAP